MSSLKNKLYNYEQTPPAKAWDKIAAALDESHLSDAFPSKLYNSEVTPPAAAWDKITTSLDGEEGPKVVRMEKRGFAFLRYAAAVLVIGLITLGIVKWTGSNKGTTSATEGLATTQEHQSTDKQTPPPDENSIADNNPERENTIPDENIPHSSSSLIKTTKYRKVKDSNISDENITPTSAIYAYNEHTPNLAERYVMLMTSNGIVRMSKKLGNIVCCVAGEEQDKDCKDQIKKWQEKLAASPVAPAPGNFMDILGLVSSLNENEL
jgi:hypothetical protein